MLLLFLKHNKIGSLFLLPVEIPQSEEFPNFQSGVVQSQISVRHWLYKWLYLLKNLPFC